MLQGQAEAAQTRLTDSFWETFKLADALSNVSFPPYVFKIKENACSVTLFNYK